MPRRLVLACERYDRTDALRDGRVTASGIELEYLVLPVEELIWRMLGHREFDVAETSLGSYIVRRDRGVDDLVAIPVFTSRSFRHAALVVRADSELHDPRDLRGRRVGVPEYQMTAAVWVRGFLADDFGVAPSDVHWVQGGVEAAGRTPRERVHPPGVELADAPPGATLAGMLADGAIDVLLTARQPSPAALRGAAIRPLLPDPAEAARDFFRRTGIFPPMHTVVLRREVLDEDPWIAQSLVTAFAQAKKLAIRGLRETSALTVSLPFLQEHHAATVELMGTDYWPYGLGAENRHALTTMIGYMHREGLIGAAMAPESLFAESTRSGEFRV
jgi:4,5-dihydroxyphthalate decarboxylase